MVQFKVNSILSINFLLLLIFLTKVRATELDRFYPTSCKGFIENFGNSLHRIRQDLVQVQVHINKEPFYVKCNQEINGGGWTVVLRRYDGKENFDCNWNDCARGFGNINGDFFIGLERLHDITSATLHELMFIMEDFESVTKIAKYDAFAIEDENNAYRIYLLGNYTGNAGDSFTYHAGRKFSAKDKDHTTIDCAAKLKGGPGWFDSCSETNIFGKYLNGRYEAENYLETKGMFWEKFHDLRYSLKKMTMMIRPIN